MVWVAIDRTTGLPVEAEAPVLALQRARRHRVDVDRYGRRLTPGQTWRQRFTCAAGPPDAGTGGPGGPAQSVHVLYEVEHTPQGQGDGFTFLKWYFSEDWSLQWLHLRPGVQPHTWTPSPVSFNPWYS